MANSIFALTATGINKVVGGNWNDETQLLCHMADGIADLTSEKAQAQFVSILSQLGVKLVKTVKIGDASFVDIFNTTGKASVGITDEEKRARLAQAIFGSVTFAHIFNDVTGDALDTVYRNNIKDKKENNPYQLFRIRLGKFVLYRITNDPNESVGGLVHKAVRQLVDGRKATEDDFELFEVEE